MEPDFIAMIVTSNLFDRGLRPFPNYNAVLEEFPPKSIAKARSLSWNISLMKYLLVPWRAGFFNENGSAAVTGQNAYAILCPSRIIGFGRIEKLATGC
jgi:hypothetical protein